MSDLMKKELSININTNVDTESIKKAKNIIESFRQECESRSIEIGIDKKSLQIDTRGFYKAINAAKDLEKQLHTVEETAPKMMKALEQSGSGRNFANNFRNELKTAMATFNDGSVISGFDNIISKISEGFSIVAVDLGDRAKHIKDQISDILNSIKNSGAELSYEGKVNIISGVMDIDQIEQRIELIKELFSYQKELEKLNGKNFSSFNSPTGFSSNIESSLINNLKYEIAELEEYNLRTTEQLQRRKEIIQESENIFAWDNDNQNWAKENIKDDEIYNESIKTLQNYINERKGAIQKLKDNEYELFSTDGITEHINNANTEIARYEAAIKELQDLRSGNVASSGQGITGDLTGVVEVLGRIETAINGVVEAFKPLTDALSNENSAISAMVNANISDLQRLKSEVEETFTNIKTISEKDFSSQTTHVLQQTINSPGGVLKAQRAELKELTKLLGTYQAEIEKIRLQTPLFEKYGVSHKDQLDLVYFNPTEMLGNLSKATSAGKLDAFSDVLDDYKQLIFRVTDQINKVEPGKINLDAFNKLGKVDPNILNVDKASANVDGVLSEIISIRDKINSEIQNIRSSFSDIFKFDFLNPNFDNIKSITDNIYQQFENLQQRLKGIDFTIGQNISLKQIADAGAGNTAVSINKEGAEAANVSASFESAAAAKTAFANANRDAAQTAINTVSMANAEGKAIEEVGKKAEQSAAAIEKMNGGLDKIKTVRDSDGNLISKVTTETIKKANAYVTKQKSYTYNDGIEELDTTTIINDFKKRQAELKKESAKIELAKKTVAKFLSQFNNKTAGHGSDIAGYNELLNFDIKSLDDIETAMQRMIALDTTYNKLTQSFRKGTKSMNPFVNAFNSMDEMKNKVRDAQLSFENLKSPGETLTKSIENLPTLLQNLENALKPKDGVINIEAIAEAYGKLNEAIKQVNSSISLQQREEKSQAAKTKAEKQQIESLYKLYDEQAKSAEKIHEHRTKLNSGTIGKEELKLVNTQLIQEKEKFNSIQKQIEAYGELYNKAELVATVKNRIHMVDLKESAAEEKKTAQAKEQDLNSLYKERSATITRIIQLNKRLNSLKTDKAKTRVEGELDEEKRRLSLLDEEIAKHGELIDKQKIQKQNKRLSDSQTAAEVSADQQRDLESVNRALQRRKEIHSEIVSLQKQLNNASGEKESSTIEAEINKLKTLEAVYTKYLATFKDNAIQRMVTDQDNAFRVDAEKIGRQQTIKDSVSADKAATESQKQDYLDILDLINQINDAKTSAHKLQIDPSTKVHTNEINEQIKKIQEYSNLLKEVYGIDVDNLSESLNKNSLLTQEQKNKLLEQEREHRQKIVELTAQAADKAATAEQKEASKYGKTIFNRENRYYESLNGRLSSMGADTFNKSFIEKIQQYNKAYTELQELRNKFANDPSYSNDAIFKNQFQASAANVEQLRKELTSTLNEYNKLANHPGKITSMKIDPNEINDAKTAMLEFANSVTDGQFKFKGFNAAGTEAYGTIDQGNGTIKEMKVALNGVTNEMTLVETGVKNVSNSWTQLENSMKGSAKQLVSRYLGFYRIWQVFKTGVNYVKEIDLAMTELKKVTEETDETYNRFLANSSKTASVIGSTVSDFTNATAAFARLGYTINESASMAESAIIYKNVADGLDSVDEATDSIISTMMAFGIASSDTMSIIDKFNAVGKLLPKLYSNI